jgi:hypothetical protein
VLADLSERLMTRDLPKTIPLPIGDDAANARAEAHSRAADVARRHGLRPELHVFVDETSDTPYAEPDDDSPDGVWVSIRHAPIRRLGDVSFLLKNLKNKRIDLPRLVFPAQLRDEILPAIEGVIG